MGDHAEPTAAWLQTAISDVGGRQATFETPPAAVGWSRENPYRASLMENRRLFGPKSGKEIRHIVFDLGTVDSATKRAMPSA